MKKLFCCLTLLLSVSTIAFAKENSLCKGLDSSSKACKVVADVMYSGFINGYINRMKRSVTHPYAKDKLVQDVKNLISRDAFDSIFYKCGETITDQSLAHNCFEEEILKSAMVRHLSDSTSSTITSNSDNATVYGIGCQYNEIYLPIFTYYQKKSTDEVIKILTNLSNQQILEKDNCSAAGITGFITGLFIEQPALYDQIHKQNYSEKMRKLIEFSHASSKIIDWEKIANNKSFFVKTLNTYWGLFFATGNETPIKAIANFAYHNKSEIALRAKMSLILNGTQHPIVKKIIDKNES
ncbi:MAG: hypothetical protein J6Y85_04340 [Alphaproteobacteria bacterium]|nr:hypothetical protein [Alphaproteobacteria bacterium]